MWRGHREMRNEMPLSLFFSRWFEAEEYLLSWPKVKDYYAKLCRLEGNRKGAYVIGNFLIKGWKKKKKKKRRLDIDPASELLSL